MPNVILNNKDITAFCGKDLTITDNIESAYIECNFKVVKNLRDKLLTARVPAVNLGDSITIIGDTETLFEGTVVETDISGEYVAFDDGFYLGQNDVTIQFNKTSCKVALSKLCEKAGIPLGGSPALGGTIDGIFIDTSVLEILKKIIEKATSADGRNYFFRVKHGKLCVYKYPDKITFATHKFESGNELNITWALGSVEGKDSITEMRNKIVVVSENNGDVKVLAEKENSAAISKFGAMTKIVKHSENEDSPFEVAKNMLDELGNIKVTRSVSNILGSDAVHAGTLLLFSSPQYDLTGPYMVKSVTHNFGTTHTMSLELENSEVI